MRRRSGRYGIGAQAPAIVVGSVEMLNHVRGMVSNHGIGATHAGSSLGNSAVRAGGAVIGHATAESGVAGLPARMGAEVGVRVLLLEEGELCFEEAILAFELL
jgi:hypothetical protein